MQAGTKMATVPGKLKLPHLAAEVQALRDVKHFVKDYQGHLPPVQAPGDVLTSQVIMCLPRH